MREHVVSQQQIGARVGCQQPCRAATEEFHRRGNAFRERDLRDVGGGLDSEHADPLGLEVLQQVPVVGGELDHMTVLPQAERVDHLLGIAAAVLEPAGRIRGEVGVVGEDLLRGLELLQLHQEAAAADQRPQRVIGLHRPDALRWQVSVGKRRGAQVDEHLTERSAAEAARNRRGLRAHVASVRARHAHPPSVRAPRRGSERRARGHRRPPCVGEHRRAPPRSRRRRSLPRS